MKTYKYRTWVDDDDKKEERKLGTIETIVYLIFGIGAVFGLAIGRLLWG